MPAFSQSSGTSTTTIYRASMPSGGRRPKTDDSFRRCEVDDCETVLSRYNLGDLCAIHAPVRFPRTRGRSFDTAEHG